MATNNFVSYLNDDYLKKAQSDLPEEDPNQQWVKDELIRRAHEASGMQTDQGGYTQVDLKPEWYKTFLKDKGYDKNGPPTTSAFGGAATAGLSALQQGRQASADKFAKLPGARAQDIMALQRKANNAGLLSGVLGSLLNKSSSDFDTQQARAVKDAEALKKNEKRGMSNNELLGIANLNKTSLRNDQLARRDAEKAAQTITEADPHSKESQDTQSAAVNADLVTPEQAAGMSKEQLKGYRTAQMQTQGQRNKTNEFDYETAVNEGHKLGAEERGETRRVAQERRDEDLRRAQNAIPGHVWANGTPPAPAQAEKARNYVNTENMMLQGAKEMKDIQNQLLEIGRQSGVRPEIVGPAAFGQYVDKYLGDDATKKLLAKAQLLQQKMVTASRAEDNLGVLQQFEKAMEDAVNPMAGTAGAYFRGAAPWDAITDMYKTYGKQRKALYGLYENGDESRPTNDPQAVPVEQQVQHYERPVAARPHPGQAAPQSSSSEFGAQPGDSLGTQSSLPAQPAGAMRQNPPSASTDPGAGSAMRGMWTITKNGKTSAPRALTEEQYKKALQLYGFDAVKQVQ